MEQDQDKPTIVRGLPPKRKGRQINLVIEDEHPERRFWSRGNSTGR